MKKAILSTLITLLIMGVRAQQVDLSGDWIITHESPRGKRSSEVSIKQEGSKATVWSNEGEYVIIIDGQKVSWNRNLATPMGNMAAEFSGEIVNSDKMSGMSSFSSGPMSGRSMNWYASCKKTKADIAKEKEAKKKGRKAKKQKDSE